MIAKPKIGLSLKYKPPIKKGIMRKSSITSSLNRYENREQSMTEERK